MDTVTIGAKGVSVSLDLAVGHIATMEVEADGRVLKPLHRAPWIGSPREALPDNLPEGTVRLSGDFLCAPFSASDVEAAPLHGWTANSEWDVVGNGAIAGGWRAVFRLRRKVMGAAVDKVFTLRDNHPFLYQEHIFSGGSGAISVAHHPMTAMQDGGRLAFSPKRLAVTPATPLEPDPARGRFRLAYPARATDLTHFPVAAGGTTDLTDYRMEDRREDFITLVEADHGGPDLGHHVLDRRADALAAVTRVVPVAELDGLMLPGRGPRGHRGPTHGPVGQHDIDLDRGVAPRVEDLAGADGGDLGHRVPRL